MRSLSPFVGCDASWLLRQRACTHGSRPFLIWHPYGEGASPRTWTFAEFYDDVRAVACGLRGHGVNRGDRVLVHLGNCPELLLTWHACARIGATAVTTNTRSSGDEVAYFTAKSRAVAAITQPRFLDLIETNTYGVRWVSCTASDAGEPASASAIDLNVIPFSDLTAASASPSSSSDQDVVRHEPSRECCVQFTSGTTARPKGVVWNHANVLWGARMAAVNMRLMPDDVSLVHFPLFHTNAMMYAHLGSLWAGASFVLVPKFSASRFWEVALTYGCTWTSTSPFVIHALSQHPVPDLHRFRFWGTGTCELPACQNTFHVKSLGWWGMTETVAFGLVGDLDLPCRPLATGRPALGYEIAIAGEGGAPVTLGESGRLLIRGIRGISLFAGYLDDAEATAAAFDEDGWFDTGDIATPFEDGYVRFEGRAKDMLRIGGENVAAAEIERAIASLPQVAEVAVVAAPHVMLEEVPVAFVIARNGCRLSAADVMDHCRWLLADFKVPRRVVFVTDLPRSTTDKVAKAELRRRLSEDQ